MNEVLEKIKKLLRMKRGGTPAEVETALALALALARKHNIDIHTVNPDEQSEERVISHEDAVRSGRIQWEQKYAMLVAQQFFNITSFLRQTGYREIRVTFVGTSSDIAIALYVYNFLVGHFRRCWNRSRGLRSRHAFLWGMYIGLCSKLEQESVSTAPAGETALVIVQTAAARRQQYMDNQFGKLGEESSRPKGDARRAKWAGFIEGQKIQIRPSVTGPVPQQRNLLT